jgi:hypothetical protein
MKTPLRTLTLPNGIELELCELSAGERFLTWNETQARVPEDFPGWRYYLLRCDEIDVAFLSFGDDITEAMVIDEIEDDQIDGPYFHADGELLYWESVWVAKSWRRQGVLKALTGWVATLERPVFCFFENADLEDSFDRDYAVDGPNFIERVALGLSESPG